MSSLIEKLEKEIAEGESALENLESLPNLFVMHTGTMAGLNMALDIVKQHSDWVSVSEPPKHDKDVTVWLKYQSKQMIAFYKNRKWHDEDGELIDPIILSFWAELPQPPSEVQNATDN